MSAATPTPPVPAVDPGEAQQRLAGGALLLDVREPDEWTAGHVRDAAWIPMRQLAARRSELPTNHLIVVACRTGARSARVTAALLGVGYDATNLAGGLQAWVEAGLTLVTDAGAAGTVI